MKKHSSPKTLLILLLAACTIGIVDVSLHHVRYGDSYRVINFSQDSLDYWIDKNKNLVVKADNIEIEKGFLNDVVKSLRDDNSRLSNLVKEYKKELKRNSGSVTTVDVETDVDVSVPISQVEFPGREKDAQVCPDTCLPTYHYTLDSLASPWLYGSIVASADSVRTNLTSRSAYDLFVGIKRKGWLFPKYESVTELRSYNPNSTVTSLRTVRVSPPKTARFGLGVQGGVGLTGGALPLYIGVGLSYNLIVW